MIKPVDFHYFEKAHKSHFDLRICIRMFFLYFGSCYFVLHTAIPTISNTQGKQKLVQYSGVWLYLSSGCWHWHLWPNQRWVTMLTVPRDQPSENIITLWTWREMPFLSFLCHWATILAKTTWESNHFSSWNLSVNWICIPPTISASPHGIYSLPNNTLMTHLRPCSLIFDWENIRPGQQSGQHSTHIL